MLLSRRNPAGWSKNLRIQNCFCSLFSTNVCPAKMRAGTRIGLWGFSPNSYINTGWKSVQCLIRFFTATKWEQSKFIFSPLDLFTSCPHPGFICTKESTPTKPQPRHKLTLCPIVPLVVLHTQIGIYVGWPNCKFERPGCPQTIGSINIPSRHHHYEWLITALWENVGQSIKKAKLNENLQCKNRI